jgi:hypothetical protein
MGKRYDAESALGNRESGRHASRYSKTCSPRSAAHLRLAVPTLPAASWTRLLGHFSIQTTEHYLGCKQKLRYAVNDKMGIEP